MQKLNKIIGEAVLISPLFVLSIFFDLWSECLLIIALLFLYKSIYPLQYHADKNIVCIVLSYSTVIIGLVIAYVFRKQYLLIILLFNAVAFINARVGSMQRKAQKYELIAVPYAELVEFYNEHKDKPKAYTFDDLINLGLTDRQADLCLAKKRGIKGERLIDYMLAKGYDFSKSTCDREVKIIKERLQK